ncbi:hypothetical protein AB0G15_32535 [Streptosporangium sp. NPDC023825]|uniref:hypothetical protein n=1 Tax=Streptosporangium sp. NPDC023825 TaxID=3154909 RepID=UPI0034181F24
MEIKTFLFRYAGALTAGDLDGIAACYGYPSLILGDESAQAVAEASDVKNAFAGAAERYRAQGLTEIRPTIGETTRITERLVDVKVRWEYLDAEGVTRAEGYYRYTLRGDDGDTGGDTGIGTDTGTGDNLAIHVVVPIPAAEFGA